jgi:hypothetical protein
MYRRATADDVVALVEFPDVPGVGVVGLPRFLDVPDLVAPTLFWCQK